MYLWCGNCNFHAFNNATYREECGFIERISIFCIGYGNILGMFSIPHLIASEAFDNFSHYTFKHTNWITFEYFGSGEIFFLELPRIFTSNQTFDLVNHNHVVTEASKMKLSYDDWISSYFSYLHKYKYGRVPMLLTRRLCTRFVALYLQILLFTSFHSNSKSNNTDFYISRIVPGMCANCSGPAVRLQKNRILAWNMRLYSNTQRGIWQTPSNFLAHKHCGLFKMGWEYKLDIKRKEFHE